MLRFKVCSPALALVLAAHVAVAADPAAADNNDKQSLQGTWKCVSAERAGKPYERPVGDKFVFAGDALTVKEKNTDKDEKATFTLDDTKLPKTIDIKPQTEDKKALGIYELKTDQLKICFTKPGGDRPTDFATAEGSTATLVVFEREK